MMFRYANQITIMYLVIVALFFNTATSMAAFGSDGQSSKGTLLCTLQGYQWVSLDGVDEPVSSSFVHCKLCLFPSAGDSLGDYFVSIQKIPLLDVVSDNSIVSEYLLYSSYSPYTFAQGRAPPLVV